MTLLMRNLVLCGLLTLLCAEPALAHALRLFVQAEGAVLKGRVYFGADAKAAGIKISVFGPDGTRLGEVVTDAKGAFAFQANARMDHRFVADAGGGHQAEFTVKAKELPETLRNLPSAEPSASSRPVSVLASSGISAEHLQTLLDETIARQIHPLREQLAAYEAKVRWHDVLGGLGYIIGIAGVIFYLFARR